MQERDKATLASPLRRLRGYPSKCSSWTACSFAWDTYIKIRQILPPYCRWHQHKRALRKNKVMISGGRFMEAKVYEAWLPSDNEVPIRQKVPDYVPINAPIASTIQDWDKWQSNCSPTKEIMKTSFRSEGRMGFGGPFRPAVRMYAWGCLGNTRLFLLGFIWCGALSEHIGAGFMVIFLLFGNLIRMGCCRRLMFYTFQSLALLFVVWLFFCFLCSSAFVCFDVSIIRLILVFCCFQWLCSFFAFYDM